MPTEAPALLEQLGLVLARERRVLTKGDLNALHSVIKDKTKLVDALKQSVPHNSLALASVKNDLKRNKDLLQSAMQGIEAAAIRLQDLQATRSTLSTYDQSGQKRLCDLPMIKQITKRA